MFVICMALSIALLITLSRPVSIGGRTIPALGHFLNPFTGFWNQAESGKAGSHENYYSSDLVDSIQIEFDKRMIPHIFAQSSAEAFYAQGFLHAKNRLFQMDITARAISGRLSELLGEETLNRDIFARRINFPQAIENKYQSWQRHPDMMALAEAYVNGVNHYLKTLPPKNYPVEYKLLGAQPEKWTIQKTIAITLSLAATLNLNLQDYPQTNTMWDIGPKMYEKLFPLFPDSLLPVDIEKETYPDSVQTLDPQSYQGFNYLKDQLPPDPGPGIGSNNWAVRAALTKDSFPILANDPHLRLSLPSIWYELQMHTPEFTTHGVSVPGMPSIVIGFNKHIAWGLTNAPIDVLDTYKIKWKDKNQGTYLLDGKEKKAKLRKEIIKIKGEPTHTEEVYDTYWGPVLFDNSMQARQDIAVKWMSALPHDKCDMRTLYGLMRSKDLFDYQAALESFYAPAQNIIFASTQDSIAITVQGKFPVKRPGQGRFVLDGSLTSNDWQGIIPMDDLPRMINPERGYVLSANEWSTYPEYPYYYSGRFDQYRGRAIDYFLRSDHSLTVEKMKAIQQSNFNLKAAEVLPVLIDHLSVTTSEKPLIDSLRNWDYYYDPDSPLPTITELWIEECKKLTFDEISSIDSISMLTPNTWRLLELLQNPYDTIFDRLSTPESRESAREIVQASWDVAHRIYTGFLPTERHWGRYASLSIDHLLGIPEFSRQNLYTGGNGNTINAITRTNGPSWRMIVELGKDSVTGHVIYPGGQSGNPGSPYYDNFLDDWLSGKYYEVSLAPTPTKIKQSIHYSIYLLPQ